MTRRERLVLVAATIGFSMVLLDTTTVNVALGAIARDFHANATTLQWVANAYTLVFAGLLLSTGAASDRLGPRLVFVAGLATFAVGSLAATLSPSASLLIASQAVLGIGAALVLPTSLSLLRQEFVDQDRRTRAIGVWAGGSAIAFAAGPVVGGLLVQQASWRTIFALNLPLVAVAAFIVQVEVPRRRAAAHQARDVALLPQVLAMLMLVALTFGLVESGADGWGSPSVLCSLALAVLFAVALVWHERTSPHRLIPHELVSDSRFVASAVAGGLINFGFYGELFFLSLFLQQERGLDPLQTGLAFLPQPAGFLAVSTIAGGLVAARGARPVLFVGGVISTAGALALLPFGRHASLAVLGVGLLLNGVGGGLAIPAVTAGVMRSAPAALAGIASAGFTAGRQVGGVLGVSVLGAIATSGGRVSDVGMRRALVLAAVALAATAALSLRLTRTRPYTAIGGQPPGP